MPRFAGMLARGMRARGHQVEVWAPQAQLTRLPVAGAARKWLGYADQYFFFPMEVRRRLKKCSPDTLFVFTDHALGPWVPLVSNRPHIIHCHDFLAQRSALGEIEQNPTSWTGRRYQAFIKNGYTQGKHFVSVSKTTQQDLHRFLSSPPIYSEVVYNGLNQDIHPLAPTLSRSTLGKQLTLDLAAGYLLHVGGNQWYKNREGVLELYEQWRASLTSGPPLPLLLIGERPSDALVRKRAQSVFSSDIHFLTGLGDESVRLAYAGATAFLFPSLAEGFGWPIAEAMAAGCPVVTTAEAPMTEVGGTAAFYIPRRPPTTIATEWATAGAQVIQQVVMLPVIQRQQAVEAGLANARRFNPDTTLDTIESIYQSCLGSR